MKKILAVLFVITVLSVFLSVSLYAGEIGKGVKVTYLGHSAFKIVSPKGVVVYIDPFLSGNPKTPAEMKTVEKADLILVTHGHGDHVGDTNAIAGKTNAKIVGIGELGRYLIKKGAKKENVIGVNGRDLYLPGDCDHHGPCPSQFKYY
jgi:L-ascorbate metabolism protein UlaG (beta-lactamase superfamily)